MRTIWANVKELNLAEILSLGTVGSKPVTEGG